MTPERLRELRQVVHRIIAAGEVNHGYKLEALAIIDAELAKPEVCVWTQDDAIFVDSHQRFQRHHLAHCPDCGKRVEVA